MGLVLFAAGLGAGAAERRADPATEPPRPAPSASGSARTLFVRQTVGSDEADGISPGTAWRSLARAEAELRPGDTLVVGPGLYRERLVVRGQKTELRGVAVVADPSGQRTGDPPGVVMIAGSDPVDESSFRPGHAPGVYVADGLGAPVRGVVEMDGPQTRYQDVRETPGALRDGVPLLELVAAMPSSFWYDVDADAVHLHTSDGKPPKKHELELFRRDYGIVVYGSRDVSVSGFTFRHTWVAGVNFEDGACHGVIAGNTSYGSWQGIRVADASEVDVVGNTSFRNGNSGVYFLQRATHNRAVGNVVYQNAQGLRWSSGSSSGAALDNTVFENRDAGISLESVDRMTLAGNALAGNGGAQLASKRSEFRSRGQCYEITEYGQALARIDFAKRYDSLDAFRAAERQDPDSREGCGGMPRMLDVRRLHRSSLRYAERARKTLEKRARRDARRAVDGS